MRSFNFKTTSALPPKREVNTRQAKFRRSYVKHYERLLHELFGNVSWRGNATRQRVRALARASARLELRGEK